MASFLVADIFTHQIMVGKGVHFDIWNKEFFKNGSSYDLAHFSNLDLAEK